MYVGGNLLSGGKTYGGGGGGGKSQGPLYQTLSSDWKRASGNFAQADKLYISFAIALATT